MNDEILIYKGKIIFSNQNPFLPGQTNDEHETTHAIE